MLASKCWVLFSATRNCGDSAGALRMTECTMCPGNGFKESTLDLTLAVMDEVTSIMAVDATSRCTPIVKRTVSVPLFAEHIKYEGLDEPPAMLYKLIMD